MVVIRSRNNSETKEFMRKLKKMHKFTKELIDCVESEYEDDEFDDDFNDFCELDGTLEPHLETLAKLLEENKEI